MSYARQHSGLGGYPADWTVENAQGGVVVNPAYVNRVLMPDGSVSDTGILFTDRFQVNAAEVNDRIAARAWAFEAKDHGTGRFSVVYHWAGVAPSSGSIVFGGGDGQTVGTATPQGFTPAPGGASPGGFTVAPALPSDGRVVDEESRSPGTTPVPFLPTGGLREDIDHDTLFPEAPTVDFAPPATDAPASDPASGQSATAKAVMVAGGLFGLWFFFGRGK